MATYFEQQADSIEVDSSWLCDALLNLQASSPGPVNVEQLFEVDGLFRKDSLYKQMALARDCVMALRDLTAIKEYSSATVLEHLISVELFLFGGLDTQRGDDLLLNNCIPRIHLARHGEGCKLIRYFKKGDSVRSLGFWISPQVLTEQFGLDINAVSEQLRPIFADDRNMAATLPLPEHMRNIVGDMLSMHYQGQRADIYLRARFNELVCHILDYCEDPGHVLIENSRLNRRKRQAMEKTISILDKEFASPLSLAKLADRAGMSLRALANTFQENFSVSISDYLTRRRMDEARKLLREGALSVMEVAMTVGYDNQSSFGRAYKRYFNRTPKDDRGTVTKTG